MAPGGRQSHEIPEADRKSTAGNKRNMSGVREQLCHVRAYSAGDEKHALIICRL